MVTFNSSGVDIKKQMPADEFFDLILPEDDDEETPKEPVTSSDFGVPGTLARRRAAMAKRAAESPALATTPTLAQEEPTIGSKLDQPQKPEEKPAEPTVLDQDKIKADTPKLEDKMDLRVEKKPEAEAQLEDFVEFGADGVIKDEKLANVSASKFEPPVEAEATVEKAPVPKPEDIQLGNNNNRVENILGAKPIDSPKAGFSEPDKPEEGEDDGEAEKAFAEMSAETPKAPEPKTELPVEPSVVTINPSPPAPPAPVVTMDPTPEVQVTTNSPADLVNQNRTPIQAEAPAIEPAAPEKVPEVPIAQNEGEIPITYQPEAKAPAPQKPQEGKDNGVDKRVQEIQDRINNSGAKAGQEVAEDQTTNVEPTIAPPPAFSGMQSQPEATANVQQDDQPYPISNLDPRKAARSVNGNENASFFSKLSQRFNKKKPTAEELPKAA